MDTRDFLLLAYKAFHGEINGKTTLQKKLYFLGVMLGELQNLRYRPHYYGPYSSSVAEANEDIKSIGYIEESVISGGSVNSQGFEVARYDYKLTEFGNRIADQKIKKNKKEWEKIKNSADIINDTGESDYMRLSIAAKAYYVLSQNDGEISLKEIKDLTKKLGWSVDTSELKKAANFLEKIDLVKQC